LELTQQEEFKQILGPLFRQLSRAIGSPHFQVAERALFLWHNDYISGLIADNRRDILPIIYPVLHVNSESHWNLTVKNLTYNVLKIFMELDTPLVEQCSKAYVAKKGKDEIRITQKLEIWTKLGADVKDKSAWLLAADKKSVPETKYRDSIDNSSSSTSTTTTTNPSSPTIDNLTTSFSGLTVPDDTEASIGPNPLTPSSSSTQDGVLSETPISTSTTTFPPGSETKENNITANTTLPSPKDSSPSSPAGTSTIPPGNGPTTSGGDTQSVSAT